MREAMANAEVGDDVFGEDPTVCALEAAVAEVTGKEAALFVPSGTMGNQLAIAVLTRPGDDVIVGEGAHLVHNEGGAGAALSGVQFTVAGRGGLYAADELEAALHPRADWTTRPSLAAIENTHNRGGGRVWPMAQARAVADRAQALGLATHLDGARIWNASVATGIDVKTLCAPFDTASVCFSKGLGAPIGSAFCGSPAHVAAARRLRKRWGGGMRQAGVLAAAALHALTHHRARLADDHAHAKKLAERLARAPGIHVAPGDIETNIVYFDVDAPAGAVALHARRLGIGVGTVAPRTLRAVTHLDVSMADVETAADGIAAAVERARHEAR
ncbi:MAG: beta-eliminating lyase-related protein [Polyangiaceae bacterium]|nr:beta-eliminating lyase-related protein [Polyangiaceae bacterium]